MPFAVGQPASTLSFAIQREEEEEGESGRSNCTLNSPPAVEQIVRAEMQTLAIRTGPAVVGVNAP